MINENEIITVGAKSAVSIFIRCHDNLFKIHDYGERESRADCKMINCRLAYDVVETNVEISQN